MSEAPGGASAPGDAAAPPPQPASPEEAVLAIQAHRAAIVEAQHRVLRRDITMPEYNALYRQHLEAIHALEAWLHDAQLRAQGSGAGLY